jgi:hypothetical protein
MLQVNQKKQKNPLFKRFSSRLFFVRDRLGILALIISILGLVGLIASDPTWKGIGGILFGTGLTVLVSRWSNREQLAKDANLRRKTDLYVPLHTELQNLQDRLVESSTDDLLRLSFQDRLSGIVKPSLQHIDFPEQTTPRTLEELPHLYCWPEYKKDSRSLEFSESSRQMLNRTHQIALIYNNNVNAALEAFEAILAPHIKEAITRVQRSEEYEQWLKKHPNGINPNPSPTSLDDWFMWIYNATTIPMALPVERSWAMTWLDNIFPGNYRPETLGWLLSGNCEKAAHAIYRVCFSPGSGYPPPPIDWIRAILEAAWPEIESHSTYRSVQMLNKELYTQVSQAEKKLMNTLRYIQDTYEGGPPPL